MKTIIMVFIATLAMSAGFAQKSKNRPVTDSAALKVVYTCTMHPQIISHTMGKCPLCNKDLTQLSKKEQMKMQTMKLYTCPMHADVMSKTPGKCPICNMDLTPVKPKAKSI